ncbi:hypothetical protein [Streptomyces sp. 7N604]|uniref:hypothetical protein n=1 Tax=Streptomyces sp. 7N604 TaxID=3457415 RepID=UPI003FD3A014
MLSEAWWSIWWPWMLLWSATAAAAMALVYVTATWLSRGRRARDQRVTDSICFYLNDELVMDHYQMRGYAPALRKEVELRTSDSKNANIRAAVFGVGAGGGKRDSVEVVSKYLEVAEPISVIGLIVDVLERKDAIVHVDLVGRAVRRNRALADELAARPGPAGRVRAVRLQDMEPFVLIRGRFRKIDETTESTVFLAPYGAPEDPEHGRYHVRLRCATEGLRNEVPAGPFRARCFGKVENWNSEEGVLEVLAFAIFR